MTNYEALRDFVLLVAAYVPPGQTDPLPQKEEGDFAEEDAGDFSSFGKAAGFGGLLPTEEDQLEEVTHER